MRAKSRGAKGNGTFPQLKELMLGDEQRELRALRESLEDQERFLAELRDDLEGQERQLTGLRGDLEEKGKQLAGLRGDADGAQRERAELREGLEEKAKELAGLRGNADGAQHERAELREGLEEKAKELTGLRDDLEDKAKQITGLRDDADSAQRERAGLRGGLEDKAKEITGLRDDADSAQRERADLRGDLEDKAKQLAGLRDDADSAQRERADLRGDLEDKAKQLAGLRDDADSAQRERAELRGDLEDKAKQLAGLRGDLEKKAKQITDLRGDLEKKAKQLTGLRDDIETKGGRISDLRNDVDDAKSRIEDLREGLETGQRERADLRDGLDEKERALAELRENLEAERDASDALRKGLENEQSYLHALRERLDAREADSVERLASDLAAALRRRKELGQESFDDLVAALQSGTESAIQRSVSTDKQPLTKALFPIMGPAIRNYVVELFRNMAAELNETISNATSVERFKWRFEARMAGKPYSEYVLLKTRSFRIEEVYLIQRDTGLLLLHAAINPVDEAHGEADLVSGMFTAIRSFVRDSFAHNDGAGATNGDEEELDSFTFGEREVLIEVGPSMVLAAVAHGVPAPSLRDELKGILENLHAEMQDRLDHFSGDTADLESARPTLRKALVESRAERDEQSGSGGLGKVWLLLGVIALGLAAWIFVGVREQTHWSRFEVALRAQPGIAVTEVADAGWWRQREVRGLRDPLAADPATLAEEYKIDLEKTTFAFGLMESLEPGLKDRRAAAAAAEKKALLTQLEIVRDAQAKSEADASTRAAVATESLVRSLFADVPGLEIAFTDDGIRFQGDLAEDDYKRTLSRLEPLKTVSAIDTSGLSNDTGQRIAALVRQISSSSIPFREGALEQEDEKKFDRLAGMLSELNELASKADISYAFTILSHPLIGANRAANRVVEEERADQVRQRLIGKGFAPEILETRLSEDFAREGQGVIVLPAKRSSEP